MKIGDAASGLFADVLGAAVVFEARTFPPMPGQLVGPSLFPVLIGAWLIVSGVRSADFRHVAGARWAGVKSRSAQGNASLNLALVLVGLLFYLLR